MGPPLGTARCRHPSPHHPPHSPPALPKPSPASPARKAEQCHGARLTQGSPDAARPGSPRPHSTTQRRTKPRERPHGARPGEAGPLRQGEAGRDAAAVPPAGPDAPVPGEPPSPSACHVRSPRRTAAQRPPEGLFPAGGCRVPPPSLNGSPAPSLRTSASGPCHSRQGGAGEGGRGLLM